MLKMTAGHHLGPHCMTPLLSTDNSDHIDVVCRHFINTCSMCCVDFPCLCFTGVRGWFSLQGEHTLPSTSTADQSHPVSGCPNLGAVELRIAFAQLNDRQRVVESARQHGWLEQLDFEQVPWETRDFPVDDKSALSERGRPLAPGVDCFVRFHLDQIWLPVALLQARSNRVTGVSSARVRVRIKFFSHGECDFMKGSMC